MRTLCTIYSHLFVTAISAVSREEDAAGGTRNGKLPKSDEEAVYLNGFSLIYSVIETAKENGRYAGKKERNKQGNPKNEPYHSIK